MVRASSVRRSYSSQHTAVIRSAVSPPPRRQNPTQQAPARPPSSTGPTATSQRARAAQTAEQKRAANAKRKAPAPPPRSRPKDPRPKPTKEKQLLTERARRVLGLPPRFSEPELRAAFRREAKVSHPDHKGDPKRFRLVMSAYKFLQTELDR